MCSLFSFEPTEPSSWNAAEREERARRAARPRPTLSLGPRPGCSRHTHPDSGGESRCVCCGADSAPFGSRPPKSSQKSRRRVIVFRFLGGDNRASRRCASANRRSVSTTRQTLRETLRQKLVNCARRTENDLQRPPSKSLCRNLRH